MYINFTFNLLVVFVNAVKFAQVPIYFVDGCLRKQFLSICGQNTLFGNALVLNIRRKTVSPDIFTPGTSLISLSGPKFKILQTTFLQNFENREFS